MRKFAKNTKDFSCTFWKIEWLYVTIFWQLPIESYIANNLFIESLYYMPFQYRPLELEHHLDDPKWRKSDKIRTRVDTAFIVSQQVWGLFHPQADILKHMAPSFGDTHHEAGKTISSYIDSAKKRPNREIWIHDTLEAKDLEQGDIVEITFSAKKISTENPCVGSVTICIDTIDQEWDYVHGMIVVTAWRMRYIRKGNIHLPIQNRWDHPISLLQEWKHHLPVWDIWRLIHEDNIITMNVYKPHPIARIQYQALLWFQWLFSEFRRGEFF